MTLRFALASIVTLMMAAHARANDLEEFYIRSVEWLTQKSSTIVVADFSDSKNPPVVDRVLKGNADWIRWPLKPASGLHIADNNHTLLYSPPSNGKLRLLFIAEGGRLLQSIRLDREQQVNRPTMQDVFYGADQFGRVLQTQSDFFRCITAATRKQTTSLATRHDRYPSLIGYEAVSTPPQFPLDNNGDCYYLVVPFTYERQAYFAELLSAGDASDRIYAISQLANFGDKKSWRMIEDAAQQVAEDITPSYQRNSGGAIKEVSGVDVVDRAKEYLKLKPNWE